MRLSQFVDPQIIQDGPSSADNSRLDVIDQLDISGLTGGSCTYFVANLFQYSITILRTTLVHHSSTGGITERLPLTLLIVLKILSRMPC